MEIKIRKIHAAAAGLFAVSILVASLVSSLVVVGGDAHSELATLTLEKIGFDNIVYVYKNGELVAWGKNTVTNHGLNHTRDVLMGRVASAPAANVSILQLSTGGSAPAATDISCEATVVVGNGLDAAAGTITEQKSHTGNYSVNKTWSATGTQAGIAKVCLHNSTVTGVNITFATALLSSAVNVENGDTLSVFYFVDLS